MKILIPIAFIVFCFKSSAQNSFNNYYSDSTLFYTHPWLGSNVLSGDLSFDKIAQLDSNRMLLLGKKSITYYNNDYFESYPMSYEIDKNGVVLNKETFDTITGFRNISLFDSDETYFYGLGVKEGSPLAAPYSLYLVKYNSSGQIVASSMITTGIGRNIDLNGNKIVIHAEESVHDTIANTQYYKNKFVITDLQFNIIDSFNISSSNYGFADVELSDANSVLASGNFGPKALFIEFDLSGNVIQYKTYNHPSYPVVTNYELTFGKDFIYFGGLASGGGGWGFPGDSYLMKTDLTGDTIWTYHFNYGTNDPDYIYDLIELADSGLLATVHCRSEEFLNWDELWLIKLDKNGNVLWRRQFNSMNNGQSNFDYIVSLAEDDEKKLFGAGLAYISQTNLSDTISRNEGWIIKFDSCGYLNSDYPYPFFIIDSIQSNKVYLTNWSTDYCNGTLHFDSEQEINLSPYSKNQTNDQFSFEFLFPGRKNIKLVANAGNIKKEYSIEINIIDNASLTNGVNSSSYTLIYPNPVISELAISFSEEHDKFQVLVMDAKGITLQNRTFFNSSKAALDMNEFPPGAYFIKTIIQETSLVNKIIKQ